LRRQIIRKQNEKIDGEKMTVKILIKRRVSEDKAEKLAGLIMQLRSLCIKQPGYLSGQSLRSVDNLDYHLVISAWDSPGTWNAWISNKERQSVQNQIDALLGQKTEYEMYQY
jgi:heme oxygenase (mycobilin-producing)